MQQDLCLKGLGLDHPIPETSKQKWEAWLRELPKLEQFQKPQCFKPQEFSDVKRYELHHFSDASNQGYGAVSYLRQINAVGKVHCSLIMAKSRMAPLKAMTSKDGIISSGSSYKTSSHDQTRSHLAKRPIYFLD